MDSVIMLMGKEQVLVDEQLRQIADRLFKGDANRGLNIHTYTAKESSLAECLGQGETAPFLSARRLIILKNIENLIAAEKESLLKALKTPSKHSLWVLTTGETRVNRSKFFTELSRHSKVISCQTPYRESDIRPWIVARCQDSGKRILSDAQGALIDRTGRDLTLLASRIELLCTYAGERSQIGLKDVEALCGQSLAQSVFVLYQALQHGNLKTAFETVRFLQDEGKRPHEILGALIWQFDRNIRIRNLIDQGVSPDGISRELKINRYFLDASIRDARSMRLEDCRTHLTLLKMCDEHLKKGTLRPDLALERCLLGLNQSEAA